MDQRVKISSLVTRLTHSNVDSEVPVVLVPHNIFLQCTCSYTAEIRNDVLTECNLEN